MSRKLKKQNNQTVLDKDITNSKELVIDSSNNQISSVNQIDKVALFNKFVEAKQKTFGLNDFIKEFILSFLSPQTKRNYLRDMNTFLEFLKFGGEEVKDPSEIKSYHFAIYRDYLIEQGYAPATINRRLVVIRSFMKWALANNLIDFNPLDSIKLPKSKTIAPTQAFDDEEVRILLESPDLKTKEGITHKLVLVLLFHLGLRRGEIVKIKFSHIQQERNHHVLHIQGKGGKVRTLPLADSIIYEIYRFKERFQSLTGIELSEEDYLIQTAKSGVNKKPCDGSTIYRIVNRYAKQNGIDKNVGAHSCRATVISHLLDTKKVMIRDVADFAGHSQITTTQRYDKKRKGLDDSAAYEVDYEFEIKNKKTS